MRTLYRCLDEAQFADSFLRGEIRITTLKYCRKVEGVRNDPGDGTVDYYSGTIRGDASDPDMQTILRRTGLDRMGVGGRNLTISNNRTTRGLADAYVLCLSSDPDAISKFGAYVIRIDHPLIFFNALTDALKKHDPNVERGVCGRVTYTDRVYSHLDPEPRGHPGFIKPVVPFAEEREIRMLWFMKEKKPIEPFVLHCPEAGLVCSRRPDPTSYCSWTLGSVPRTAPNK
jgi:hypothetical protein